MEKHFVELIIMITAFYIGRRVERNVWLDAIKYYNGKFFYGGKRYYIQELNR